MRYHLTPARMAITKRTTVNKAGEDVEKRGPKYTVGGMWSGAATSEGNMEVPQDIRNRTTIWSSSLFIGEFKTWKLGIKACEEKKQVV